MTGTVISESFYGTVVEYTDGHRAFYPRSWFGKLLWRLSGKRRWPPIPRNQRPS